MSFEEKFIIKYQIKNFDDLKLPKRIKTIIESDKNKIFRFLFYGSAGLGKTTLAKILSKNHEVLYLSGSNDFSVNTLRQKVYPFCNGFSTTGKPKIVVIDECERIQTKTQDAFKIILDSSIKTTKFIFITNNVTKIIEPVKSRLTAINFNYTGAELTEQQGYYMQYIVDICRKEGIKFDKEGMMEFFKRNFPDFRKSLTLLETFKNTDKSISVQTLIESQEIVGKQNQEIYDLIENPKNYDAKSVYSIVGKYRNNEEEVLQSLCEPFFAYLNNKNKFEKTLSVALIMNKYTSEYNLTINKFALLLSCIQELRKLTV